MTEVTMAVDIKDLENLLNFAEACAEDLVSEVEAQNPGDHPVTVRRRERDTIEARWLLSAIPALRVKYGVQAGDADHA